MGIFKTMAMGFTSVMCLPVMCVAAPAKVLSKGKKKSKRRRRRFRLL